MEKSKKNIYLTIILIILIILSLLVIFLKLFYKKENSDDDFIKELEKNINTINNINDEISADNLEKEVNYTLLDNAECRQYMGENPKEFIKLIEKTYINSFYEYSLFNLVKSGDEEKLYVCLSKKCKIKKITGYEIISSEENKRIINFDNVRYEMNKVDGIWKFVYPVILCENVESIEE